MLAEKPQRLNMEALFLNFPETVKRESYTILALHLPTIYILTNFTT